MCTSSEHATHKSHTMTSQRRLLYVKIVRKSFKKHDRQWFSILLLSGTVFSNILASKTTPKIDRKSWKILFWLPNISSWRYKTFEEACKRPLRAPKRSPRHSASVWEGPKRRAQGLQDGDCCWPLSTNFNDAGFTHTVCTVTLQIWLALLQTSPLTVDWTHINFTMQSSQWQAISAQSYFAYHCPHFAVKPTVNSRLVINQSSQC